MITKYVIPINHPTKLDYTIIRFAYKKHGKSYPLHLKRMGSVLTRDKDLSNEFVGKLAESYVYMLLRHLNPYADITKPDFTIYPNSKATNNPDLIIDRAPVHVKGCRDNQYEPSWLYSKYCKHLDIDTHYLCIVGSDYMTIYQVNGSDLKGLHRRPVLDSLAKHRVALYLSDVLIGEQVETIELDPFKW